MGDQSIVRPSAEAFRWFPWHNCLVGVLDKSKAAMGSPVMCKVDVTAQTLVIPSVLELSARLELGASKLGVFQFAASEIPSTRGGASQPLISGNDFTLVDDQVVCSPLRVGVLGAMHEGRRGSIGNGDAALDLTDERDDWIQGGTLLEQIMSAAVELNET